MGAKNRIIRKCLNISIGKKRRVRFEHLKEGVTNDGEHVEAPERVQTIVSWKMTIDGLFSFGKQFSYGSTLILMKRIHVPLLFAPNVKLSSNVNTCDLVR